MAENSNIEWTKHTFNPWIGCQKVGAGCDNCYAEVWDARGLQGGATRWGPHAARTRTSPANWRKPLAWDRAAKAAGERHRVFCASLADVFDNHATILPEWRADLWALIRATPNLDWMLLTKRPSNIAAMLPDDWGAGYPNVWLGCTVVNQAEADRDVPKLLVVPAAVWFLSMEPLLGPVTLASWLDPDKFCEGCDDGEGYGPRCCRSDIPRDEQCPFNTAVQIVTEHGPYDADDMPHAFTCEVRKLDLVIVGGESGPKARPMHPDWARSLRDQCNAAGVAFHFKQWGEWADETNVARRTGRAHRVFLPTGKVVGAGVPKMGLGAVEPDWRELGAAWMSLVGKRAAGRLLDGREWNEMPEVSHG